MLVLLIQPDGLGELSVLSLALCLPFEGLGELIELPNELGDESEESGLPAAMTTGCFRLGIGMEEDILCSAVIWS